MLFMLLLLPANMVAQTDYEEFVTLEKLGGNPEGFSGETYANLFDGTNAKWCCPFSGSAYVIFKASKAGIPVGYTITTGNDNENENGRNPLSWKLYGNNTGSDNAWELIKEVDNDAVLKDENNTSYNFKCEGSTSYRYFKWEITAIHSGSILQVGEFKLKLNTCSHKKADDSSALGEVKTVDPTCTEHGYTTQECSICHFIVKKYLNDELKAHTLTPHEEKAATCTEAGNIEYWQCSECKKLFSDKDATTEITDAASLVIPANGHQYDSKGICSVCSAKDPRYTLFDSLDGITDVTITDNGSYPWQMLDSNAEGMKYLDFTIPDDSKGLMSSNYNVNNSSSETEIKFNVSKPTLLTSQVLVSSEDYDKFDIYVDNKLDLRISRDKQTEYKVLLSAGEHSLKLSYIKDGSSSMNADRAFIYDLKTATTFSEHVAEYDATNTTLTFKKITSNNIESLDLNHTVIVYNEPTVNDVCTLLGIDKTTIKSVVFDESFKTYAPTSLREFFNGCETLETISGLEYLNTANVEFMDHMFHGCSALKSLDLTKFNTAKVTEMDHMFHGCSALKSLDLTKFNTAKVEFMYHMFEGCSALKSLDLTNFNTAKVTDMSFMFYGCSALTSLNVTNFNTTNVEDMSCMFTDCQKLTSLDLTKFNTAKVTFMNNMFYGCSALTTIYVSDKFVTDNVRYGSDMFFGCEKLKGYSKSKTDYTYANCGTDGYFTPGCGYAEFDNATGTLTFRYKGVKPEGAYELNVGQSNPKWYDQREKINKVVFDALFANARPTSCYMWFSDCSKLKDIEGIEYINTEMVTNMANMFNGCSALTSLDLSNFNTAKVEDMSNMFINCSALTTIYTSKNFVTGQVTNGDYMFSGCTNLKGVIEYDANKVDKDYANYATGYFTPEGGFPGYAVFDEGAKTLTFKWDTSIPEGAYALNEGNNYPMWYEKLHIIQNVVFDASFANARPRSCYGWFNKCVSLTKIEGIENLNTENVTNMSDMFCECDKLTSLDLTTFDTKEVTDMSSMFSYCYNLRTIYASDKFVTTKVTYSKEMFTSCENLKGFIEFNTYNNDCTYANYKTGYFSKLVGKNGDEKIGATGETLATDNLVLADDKDFVAYETLKAKDASYSRNIPEGSKWGTLCLPFAIDQSQETECKFYRLTGIDKDCITLESCEEGKIPAGTPVLFKMNEGVQELKISAQNADLVKEPVAGTNTDVNLVGSFTKIGGNDNQGLAENDYIIGKDKFWRVSDLDGGNRVGIKPMRAYIHPATASQARAAMLSIGKGDGTTAIDNLNAISNDADAEYYDVNGRRTNGLQKGLNIVKRGSKTYKIMVK